MKKKNLFSLALGVFALSIGLTSCKKDKNCAIVTYTDDGKEYTNCFCVGEDGMTQDEFDKYVSYYKNHPDDKIKLVKECK